MGLDQYMLHAPAGTDINDSEAFTMFARWRKHANLQGYLTDVWLERNPSREAEGFNCEPLLMDRELCEEIIALSETHSLPYASGFFWGESTDEDDEYTVQAMREAIALIEKGHVVIYDSWW